MAKNAVPDDMEKWIKLESAMLELPPKPKLMSDVSLAFPALVVGNYLPLMDDIPYPYKSNRHPWVNLVSSWFAIGLPDDIEFAPKEGVDPQVAFRHVDACMRSFQPKHEHKIAGCAYLLDHFFAVVRSASKKFSVESTIK